MNTRTREICRAILMQENQSCPKGLELTRVAELYVDGSQWEKLIFTSQEKLDEYKKKYGADLKGLPYDELGFDELNVWDYALEMWNNEGGR